MAIVAGWMSCYTLLAFVALKMESLLEVNTPDTKCAENQHPLKGLEQYRIHTISLTLPKQDISQ